MNSLDAVEWEACVLEPVRNAETERFVRKNIGMVPPTMRYFLGSPWVTRALVSLSLESVPLRHISPDMGEMIALVVSQDNSCRYCFAATRSIMRILGFPEARIRRLEESNLNTDLAPAEVAALEFARCVSRAAPLATDAERRPMLDAGHSPEAIKEVAFFAASNVFFNRMSTLPALPPDQMDIADRWYVQLLRPLLARFLRPRCTTVPEPLAAPQRAGPFAPIVNAIDGLPGARRLRAVIDDAWASTVLDGRTKGLVFGVIARGIGCDVCETEARRLLAEAGQPPAAIEQALAHLSGPGLAPLEVAAASLARESIWIRPAQVQRHLRSIRHLFSAEQFIELIGLAALANMVCRLGAVVDRAPHRG